MLYARTADITSAPSRRRSGSERVESGGRSTSVLGCLRAANCSGLGSDSKGVGCRTEGTQVVGACVRCWLPRSRGLGDPPDANLAGAGRRPPIP
jgi:hypothetical protein